MLVGLFVRKFISVSVKAIAQNKKIPNDEIFSLSFNKIKIEWPHKNRLKDHPAVKTFLKQHLKIHWNRRLCLTEAFLLKAEMYFHWINHLYKWMWSDIHCDESDTGSNKKTISWHTRLIKSLLKIGHLRRHIIDAVGLVTLPSISTERFMYEMSSYWWSAITVWLREIENEA